jgi:Flp pilus assembly protein TadD
LVEIGQISSGVERLKSIESRTPNAAAIHRALGEALAKNGDPKSGAQELQTAIQLNPQSAESYDILGKLQLSQGETSAAIASFERAVNLAAQDSTFHRDLAQAYQRADRAVDATREMQLSEQLHRVDVR